MTLEEMVKENEAIKKNNSDFAVKLAALEKKIEEWGTKIPVERKIQFLDAADKAKVDPLTLSIAKRIFDARIARGLDRDYPEAIKAQLRTMTEAGTGTGLELLDTAVSTELWDDAYAATVVASLFRQINMPTATMELPLALGDVTFYKPAGEGQAVTAVDPATAKPSMTAYELKAQVDIGDSLDADSIIALLPEIRMTLIRNARETMDDVIINADASTDTTNINYEGTALAANSRYLIGFNGLIHFALREMTGLTASITTIAASSFATLLGKMGKYADRPEDVVFIIDRWVKNKAIQLSDFTTMEKMGAKATLLNGQFSQIFGSPVVMSGAMAKADSTGAVDDTANDNSTGRIIGVNRNMWKVGARKPVTIETDRDISKGLTLVVATLRMGLQCFGTRSGSTHSHTVLGYNATI